MTLPASKSAKAAQSSLSTTSPAPAGNSVKNSPIAGHGSPKR
nr:MAG TPA: hypothetical protein [Caudoviricetes sp.]